MFKNNNFLFIILTYFLLSIIIQLTKWSLFFNFVNPLFWTFISIAILIYYYKSHYNFNLNKKYLCYAGIISLIYIIFNFYLGIFIGYAQSPYNHHLLAIIKNIIITINPLIGMELTRNIFFNKYAHKKINIILITILLFLVNINFHYLFTLSLRQEIFKYGCSSLIPLFVNNILATYLCLNYSFIIPLIIKTITKFIILLIPIIPNYNWFISGSLNIIIATLFFVFFNHIFQKRRNLQNSKNSSILISYALALTFSTILICFMLGVFKYEPIAILSNSMDPIFKRGDIVIYKHPKANEVNNLDVNTIIVYKLDNKFIIHRIIKKYNQDKETIYITKGDNNQNADYHEVKTGQILGIYKTHLKYLGYPSIWLNALLT